MVHLHLWLVELLCSLKVLEHRNSFCDHFCNCDCDPHSLQSIDKVIVELIAGVNGPINDKLCSE